MLNYTSNRAEGYAMHLDRRSVLAGAAAVGTAGLPGCTGDDGTGENCPTLPQEPRYGGWLAETSNYRRTCDFRGRDTATVTVGVEANQAFWGYGPAAIAILPQSTVRWEWNGRGGSHDVVERNGLFESGDPVDSETETFEVTFDQPGVFKYYCTPHRSQGMKGVVFVALE